MCDRKQSASPEDIEYYECQKEMMNDLYKSHMEVERIIGKDLWTCHFCSMHMFFDLFS